jgi:hypothetical protein
MRTALAVSVVVVGIVACTPKSAVSPSQRAASALPFDPDSIRADPAAGQTRAPFRVELAVRATRDLAVADGVAIRVVGGGRELKRIPVVVDVPPEWNGTPASKVFTATVSLPLGDYEVEVVHAGRPVLGHAFKIAEVPVWGGGRQVQYFWHQKTRLDLDRNWLRLARWVVEDEPTQAYVIEWWRAGKRVHTTTGRADKWPAYELETAVKDAYPKKGGAGRRSIWTFGAERYDIPNDLVLIGGAWEARVYREGAPPVAIAFELSTAPETQESRVALRRSKLSAELFLRGLPEGLGVERFAAIPGKQLPTAAQRTPEMLVDPVPFDRSAVRALFRSPELARKWHDLVATNITAAHLLSSEQDWNLTAEQRALRARHVKALQGRDHDRVDAERKATAERLRPQVLALIRKHSGPWQPNEIPR